MKHHSLYTRPLSTSHALAAASSLALGILLTAAPDAGRRLLCLLTSACAAAYGIPVTLAFVMSLPVSPLDFTLAKLIGNVITFAVSIPLQANLLKAMSREEKQFSA